MVIDGVNMDPILSKLTENGEDWNVLNYLEILYPGGDLSELVNDPEVMKALPPELTDLSLVGQLARQGRMTIAEAAEQIDNL
jgi:hypothetical protein